MIILILILMCENVILLLMVCNIILIMCVMIMWHYY